MPENQSRYASMVFSDLRDWIFAGLITTMASFLIPGTWKLAWDSVA